MLEKELLLEKDLFLALNGCHSPFWDNVMYIYTNMFTWIPLYLCFIFVFIYRKNWKEIVLTVLTVVLMVLLCDQLSSGLAKPYFQRLRPTHHPGFKDLVQMAWNYKGGGYSFFSGHAANSFGFATLMSLLFRNRILTISVFIFALVTAYSRIYLGVHFISDVAVGMVVGILVGLLVYRIFVLGRIYWLKIPKRCTYKSSYSKRESYALSGIYFVMVAIVLMFNNQLIKLFI